VSRPTPLLLRLLAAFVLASPLATASAQEAPTSGAAPSFSLPTVTGGTEVSLAQHRGKVVLLSFWATWCAPCKQEMPHLDALAKKHAQAGLVVLSINSDDPRTVRRVKPWLDQQALSLTVLLDTERKVLDAYDPSRTLPWSVLVGRDGEIVETWSGFDEDGFKALEAAVTKALADGVGD